MAGATPIVTGGTLLTITFDVVGNLGATSALEILSAALNEGTISTELGDGSLTVVPWGDANGDGTVNVLDMTRVAKIILGLD